MRGRALALISIGKQLLARFDHEIDLLSGGSPPVEHLGAIVSRDGTASHAAAYRHDFAFVHDPVLRPRTITLAFAGGLALTVRV
jgi:hypothetical protein